MARRLRIGIKNGFYAFLVAMLFVAAKLLFRLRVRGRANFDRHSEYIAVARHRSYWDIPVFAIAFGAWNRVHFIARKGLMKGNVLVQPVIRAYATIIDRERLESTGIGHGIALPHARIDTGHDIAMAVGRSEAGIDYDAIDGGKVHIIILVVWNSSIPGLFNHLFAGMAKFLIKEKYRNRVFNAGSAGDLYTVLSEIELDIPIQTDMILHRAGLLWKLQEIEIQK